MSKKYYEQHKKEILAKMSEAYYATHDEFLARRREYRRNNKEKVREWNRRYYLKRKAKLAENLENTNEH